MRKLVNLRTPFILALALVSGTVYGCALYFYRLSLLYVLAIVPVAAIIFIIFTAKCKRITPAVITVLSAVFFIAGTLNCFLRLSAFSESEITAGRTYEIAGTVSDKGKTKNSQYAILKGVTFDGNPAGGNLIVYLGENYGEAFETGYTVKFYGEAEKAETFKYGTVSTYAEKDIRYKSTVYAGVKSKYGFSLFGSLRSSVRDTLFNNLDKDTAAVCYGMLTGNTTEMDEGTLETFRYGGIAHIFAVSGLHIGIIYGIISFFTRKLKLNKYIAAVICCGILIFYAGICGFTISSVRALIMCSSSTACRLFKRKYDGLNALSFAVLLILLLTPFSLFSAGFQLSVCAVLGILFLKHPIDKKLTRLPRKISDGISVSLSAQAGTLPVCLANFGYLSGAGLLLNILIVPLISALFVPLFLGVFISLILPFIAPYLVYCCALPISAVISFLVSAGFEKAILTGFGAGAFAPLYFLLVFFMSDKINLKKYERLAAVSVSVLALISYSLITV